MGQLTGQYVSQSYQGLIKLENSNTGITTSLQFLEDGLGNNLPVQVSDTEISISGQLSVTGSNGNLVYDGSMNADTSLASIHANDATPWLERFYNDTFSDTNSVMSYFGWDDGRFIFHNDSTQSISISVNGYENDNLLVGDTYTVSNNDLIVSGAVNIETSLDVPLIQTTGNLSVWAEGGYVNVTGALNVNGNSHQTGTFYADGLSFANSNLIQQDTGSYVMTYLNDGTVAYDTYPNIAVALAPYISGSTGSSGTSGTSGTSGANGSSGTSGTSGNSGSSGTSGTSGVAGSSGTSGTRGSSGTSGTSGTSGANGSSGTSGTSGANGSSGTSGTSGANGSSGTSGANGSSGTSGTAGTSGSSGISNSFFNYQAKTNSTSGDPGLGHILWTNGSQTGSTQMNVSDTDSNNNNIDIFLGNLGSGSVITLQDKTNQSNYQVWRLGTAVDNTTYWTYPITLISATHQFSNNDDILFIITTTPSGTSGSSGTSGVAGSSGTSGTSPANLDRNGLITTGSLSSNTQSITGSLIISGSELYDLTIQGRIAVSGSNGAGGNNNPAISIINTSTGDNTLMKGANTTIASPSNDSQTVYTAYQMESDIISTGDAIGIQVYGGTSPNWAKGASIYVNNDALDSYNAVFGFQDKANYTDGRITALFPLDVTGSVNISGSTNITGPLYVSSSASYDVVIDNRLMVSGATTAPNPRIQVQGSDGLYSYMGRQAFHALTATGQATITSFAGGVVNFDNYDAGGTKDFGMVFEADTAGLTGWPSGPAIYSNDNLDNYPALIGFQDATNWTDGHVSILKDLNITGSLYVSSIPSGSSSNFVTWNNTTKEIEYTTSSGGSGSSGTSGTSGTSGVAGSSGTSGTSGSNGSSGTSGTSGDSIFAQTGSFWAASKDLQLTGSLLLSGSQLFDLTVQGRIAVSGSNGGGGANNPAISIINTSTGDNTLMKGSISSVSSPSNDSETYMTPYALESDIISTGDNIGIQAGVASPNWSNGASIYVNNDGADSYNAVFGFQDKAHYSDGRITALFPMDISGSLKVTGGVTGSFSGNGSGLTGITASAPVGVITTGSISTTQAITGSLIISGSAVITGSVQGNINALSISSSTASLNLNDSNFFTLQLVSGSNTYINPSNIKPGQTVNILLSTTGSATVTWPTTVKQPNSGSLYVPTTITSKDIVTLVSFDSTNLYLAAIKNFL